MYYLIQRYKFESNSQQDRTAHTRQVRCIIWYKDTNLKAIHNRLRPIVSFSLVVLSDTKIQIWKQFTTHTHIAVRQWGLYYLIQRYKFESNSQRHLCALSCATGCIIWYKDTNLKAIHNPIREPCTALVVVLSDTKIQIWKQFTTERLSKKSLWLLYYLIQRYKFESNSQLNITRDINGLCCIIWYKDTNLKAIHNCPKSFKNPIIVVLSDTKIQIWKQFTTGTL